MRGVYTHLWIVERIEMATVVCIGRLCISIPMLVGSPQRMVLWMGSSVYRVAVWMGLSVYRVAVWMGSSVYRVAVWIGLSVYRVAVWMGLSVYRVAVWMGLSVYRVAASVWIWVNWCSEHLLTFFHVGTHSDGLLWHMLSDGPLKFWYKPGSAPLPFGTWCTRCMVRREG
jgi:hypothetical protein